MSCPLLTLYRAEISGRKRHSYLFFFFVSFLFPGTIFLYDRTKGSEPTTFREIKVRRLSVHV